MLRIQVERQLKSKQLVTRNHAGFPLHQRPSGAFAVIASAVGFAVISAIGWVLWKCKIVP